MPPVPDPSASLTFDRVTLGYGSNAPVIHDLSVQVRGAGLLHVAGSNGSGKSTFVEAASGYLRPRSGSVTVFGRAAHEPGARLGRRVCRTVASLYPGMTVADHLAFAARCSSTQPDAALARCETYGLTPWLQTAAGSLSSGNGRKLWIVMSTLGSFGLVLLDEPFNGLDTHGSQVLREELTQWADTKSVVLVAHVLPEGLRVDHTVQLRATDAVQGEPSWT